MKGTFFKKMSPSTIISFGRLLVFVGFVFVQCIEGPAIAAYPNPTSDTDWPWTYPGPYTVAEAQTRFNTARANENTQLGTSIPMLTFPSQSEWDSMTDNEKANWIIHHERVDRGIPPLHGTEPNVISVAQNYADFLLANDETDHYADGHDPSWRLNQNPTIGACREFLSRSENLAYLWASGAGVWNLPLERAIYNWMYDDGPGWGHRDAILIDSYNDNSGPAGMEGFVGIGRASGGPHTNPYSNPPKTWDYVDIFVMNIFDPCSSWVYDWDATLAVDFGSGRGVYYYYDPYWYNLTGWDDAAHMVTWSDNLVTDFGGGRGLWYHDRTQWHYLTTWDDAAHVIACGSDLVVDFGGGRGIYTYDIAWNKLTSWSDAVNMIQWTNGTTNLVVDFGGSKGLYIYNTGSGWIKITGWGNTAHLVDCGTKLIADFGAGKGIYAYDGTWQKLTGWGNAINMIEWDDGTTANLVVDFGGGKGTWTHDGTEWTKRTGWDNADGMLTWNDNLVVDFGTGRGLRYFDSSSWHKMTNWDTVLNMANCHDATTGKDKLVVDFGSGHGLYYNEDGTWHGISGWGNANPMLEW